MEKIIALISQTPNITFILIATISLSISIVFLSYWYYKLRKYEENGRKYPEDEKEAGKKGAMLVGVIAMFLAITVWLVYSNDSINKTTMDINTSINSASNNAKPEDLYE